MTATSAIGLEKQTGWDVGRDPRRMTRAELELLGHGKKPLLRAIRARCLDCCADQPNEVRLCTAVTCPLWPYRMATDPWRKEPSEAQREQGRRMARKTADHASEAFSAKDENATPEVAATALPPAKLSTGKTAVPSVAARRTALGEEPVR
jgi:hypothetical protein